MAKSIEATQHIEVGFPTNQGRAFAEFLLTELDGDLTDLTVDLHGISPKTLISAFFVSFMVRMKEAGRTDQAIAITWLCDHEFQQKNIARWLEPHQTKERTSMIRFKTKKRSPNLSLDYTVQRIAQICCGVSVDSNKPLTEHRDIFRNDNGTYVLSSGNDWFLRPDQEMAGKEGIEFNRDEASDDDFRYWELEYRYTTPDRQAALDGLALFLEYTLS